MCDKPATTVEHAPPKCLFPEQKDLPPGVDLKKNLITVPSCDEHNTKKSKDDEYLLFCLLMNIANNETAFTHFKTKMMRALERNPKLIESFIKEKERVIVEDKETGELAHTYIIKVDTVKLLNSFEHIAKALYFDRYSEIFEGRCVILYDFALVHGPEDEAKINDFIQGTSQQMRDFFDPQIHAGENPVVFKYYLEDVGKGHVLRMQFYGASNIFVAFVPQGYQRGKTTD